MVNLIPNVVNMKQQLIDATWATLYMTITSAIIAGILGLGIGLVLIITRPNGILEDRIIYSFTDKVVNILRSVPFIILLAVIAPLTQYLIGTTVGTTAAIVPLIFGIFPFYARQVQNALLEIDPGVIEAAQAMGSSPIEIIFSVYLREGLSDIIRVSTFTLISLVGLTTVAGAIGYARFENDVTIVAMMIILALIFAFQIIGDQLAQKFKQF